MTLIELTKGYTAIIDDSDFEWVSRFTWHVVATERKAYAFTWLAPRVAESMHRMISRPPKHLEVDHIDGDGLNNRRENLRWATRAENVRSARKKPGCRSQYKGVCWCGTHKKWKVTIRSGGKQRLLGYFNQEIDAARAYDCAAIKNYGSFARLNLPPTK